MVKKLLALAVSSILISPICSADIEMISSTYSLEYENDDPFSKVPISQRKYLYGMYYKLDKRGDLSERTSMYFTCDKISLGGSTFINEDPAASFVTDSSITFKYQNGDRETKEAKASTFVYVGEDHLEPSDGENGVYSVVFEITEENVRRMMKDNSMKVAHKVAEGDWIISNVGLHGFTKAYNKLCTKNNLK